MAFPGFNERGCRESNRRIPRSPEFFESVLELSDEYRTTELINIVPYNNWKEATTIEPGTFRGENYGTAYLEKVAEFQS